MTAAWMVLNRHPSKVRAHLVLGDDTPLCKRLGAMDWREPVGGEPKCRRCIVAQLRALMATKDAGT